MDIEQCDAAVTFPEPAQKILESLAALPEDLTPQMQGECYQELLPDLVEVYESSPATFDIVAKKVVKKLAVRIGTLRRDIAAMLPPQETPRGDSPNERGPSQATRLVDLAADTELWHTPDKDAWGTIPVEGHTEHWGLTAKAFRRLLALK